MNKHSRSALFLMEQLIVILVFAICTAACLRIFAASHIMANGELDKRNSVTIASCAAECFKAAGGDLALTAEYLDANIYYGSGGAAIYFDKSCNPCEEYEAEYRLSIRRKERTDLIVETKITVSDMRGDVLYSLIVAAFMEVSE